MGCDIGQPLGVREVGLASRHVLHVLCVAEPQLVEQPFEAVVDRFPVDAGGLHRHRLDASVAQPCCQLTETVGRGGKRLLRHLNGPVRLFDLTAGHHGVAMHVQAGNSFAYSFHCFTSQVWIGGCRGGPGEADAGVRARSDSPWSPGVLAPDSSTHSRLQADIGDHTGSREQHFIRQGWPQRSCRLFGNERGAARRPRACSRTSY